jgi:hypothetical protein
MMLSKVVTRGVSSKAIATAYSNNTRRQFSIEQIGKRYEKPFDYKKRQYGLLEQFYDSTMKRLGENSLIITVEGNFGSGKSAFAKQLAQDIDFVYAREPDLDLHAYDSLSGGENRRELINKITGDNELYHLHSFEDWHLKPTFRGSIQLQYQLYKIRFWQMRQALLHLFSTGCFFVLLNRFFFQYF